MSLELFLKNRGISIDLFLGAVEFTSRSNRYQFKYAKAAHAALIKARDLKTDLGKLEQYMIAGTGVNTPEETPTHILRLFHFSIDWMLCKPLLDDQNLEIKWSTIHEEWYDFATSTKVDVLKKISFLEEGLHPLSEIPHTTFDVINLDIL